jgi:hypothetical protein
MGVYALRGSVLITVKIKIAAAPISHLGDIYGTLVFALEFPHRLLPGPMISTEELSHFIDPLYAMPLEPEMGRVLFKRRRSLNKTFGCGVAKSTVDCGVGA